jgi:large subunit ribosomal protein L15
MPMTRRLPKIGFNNKRFAHVYNTVNIDVFNRFEDGAVVGIDELVASGVIKKVEPYKGKGIRYSDEKVVIKETKKK